MVAKPGHLLAIEGIDGAGKHTLSVALEEALRAAGKTVARIAFPRYGTRHADIAAGALRGRFGPLHESPEAMALLFALDRAEAAAEIAALRASVDVVIADRFVASNAAYSTARLGLHQYDDVISWIATMEHEEMGVPRPDAYMLLTTPPQLARQRADARAAADASRKLDAYERNAQLQADTAAAFDRLAADNWQAPWWTVEPGESPDVSATVLAQNIAALK